MTNSSARIRLVTLSTGGCQPDWPTIYDAVGAALWNNDIYNNLDYVTNDNVTNFSDLSFRTDYGQLQFLTWLNLTDTNVQDFLQNLPNSFSMENWYLWFAPTGNGSWLNIPARIQFWLYDRLPPFIGTGNAVDYLTARDNNGNILSGIDINGLFGNDWVLDCNLGEWYYCEFNINHFTSFELNNDFDCSQVTDVPVSECQVLVNLYDNTNGDNRYYDEDYGDDWMSSYDVCDWYGVRCDQDDNGDYHVSELYLEYNNLAWSVDFSGLPYLYEIDAYSNELTSVNLSGLTNLEYLYLGENYLTDINLAGLTNLGDIELYSNNLSSISLAGLENLYSIELYDNNLSSISLAGLTNLDDVELSSNHLTTIDLAGLTNLEYLYLDDNWLSSIDNIGDATDLYQLDISDNLMTTISTSIMDTSLDTSYLDNNCRDSSISGDLFSFLDNTSDNGWWQNIENDACWNNPAEVDALIDLYNATDGPNGWDSNDNWWDRRVPVYEWYGVSTDEWMHVIWIELEENYLSGAVPASISHLSYLNYLDLYDNNITSIPSSIGELSNLSSLELSDNNISSLPETLGNLTQLNELYIYGNQLTSLPESIGNLSNLWTIEIEDNYLTTLPNSFANIENLWYVSLNNNCIYQDRLSSDVSNMLNDRLEVYWWDQWAPHCPTSHLVTTEDNGWSYADDMLVYDSTCTGAAIHGEFSVYDQDNESNYLAFTADGVEAVNDVCWNGFIYAPTSVASGSNASAEFGETWIPNETDWSTIRAILITVQAGSPWVDLVANGTTFTVNFVVSDGSVGDILNIYRSEDWTTWVANTPDATCTLDEAKVCNFQTDHLSYFAPIKETTTTNNSSNGWWSSFQKDNCPSGDTSASFYDGKCSVTESAKVQESKNTLCSIAESPFITDVNNGYLYACGIGVTSAPTIQEADMEGKLIRSHMAKMIVSYATKVNGMKPDTTKSCNFDDVTNQTTELKWYITSACQLGLMWVDMKSFDPETTVTRAQFGTILSRVLRWDKYNNGKLYYTDHLQALKDAGIMTDINNPEWKNELRGFVMLMMMRADK